MHQYSTLGFVRVIVMFAVIGMLGAGCRRAEERPVSITETREAAPLQKIPPELGTQARLGLDTLPPDHPPLDGTVGNTMPGADASPSAALTWVAPEGWTQGAERPMRLVTFVCGEQDAVECYVAELGGMGGGVAANFNRWRGQLGQPPLSESDMDSLPRISILDADAPLLEVEGAYTGMGQGQQAPQAGSKLLGTMAAKGDRAFFVKMVGPAAAVDAQREKFNEFCGSLKLGGD